MNFVEKVLKFSTPLSRATMDRAKCSNPGCNEKHGPLFLHPRCHPASKTVAVYHEGRLMIQCAECELPVVIVEVK